MKEEEQEELLASVSRAVAAAASPSFFSSSGATRAAEAATSSSLYPLSSATETSGAAYSCGAGGGEVRETLSLSFSPSLCLSLSLFYLPWLCELAIGADRRKGRGRTSLPFGHGQRATLLVLFLSR